MAKTSVNKVRIIAAVALVFGLWPGIAQAQSAASASNTAPAWTATDAQTALLGPPAEANGYTLRPPLGFVASPEIASVFHDHMPNNANIHVSAWRGAIQMDGQFPMFVMVTTAIPGNPTGDVPPDAVLEGFLTSFQHARTHVVQSKIELGQINGLPAARAYWKNIQPHGSDNKPHPMRGLTYTYFDAKTRLAIIIYAEDTAQYYAKVPSAALDAAALTLKPD